MEYSSLDKEPAVPDLDLKKSKVFVALMIAVNVCQVLFLVLLVLAWIGATEAGDAVGYILAGGVFSLVMIASTAGVLTWRRWAAYPFAIAAFANGFLYEKFSLVQVAISLYMGLIAVIGVMLLKGWNQFA